MFGTEFTALRKVVSVLMVSLSRHAERAKRARRKKEKRERQEKRKKKRLTGDRPQTGERISRARAPSIGNDSVIHRLRFGRCDILSRHNASTIHDGPSEQRLAFIRIIATVDNSLIEHGNGASGLAVDGDFGRVAAESSNVLGNPFQT